MPSIKPERVLIIDIDGLRADVYHRALKQGQVPTLQRITHGGTHPTVHHVSATSVAPSITFAAQASIFTGAHPAEHLVSGNECFDRLGRISGGRPRHFGFDVGDTLALDDAVDVFTNDLADRLLNPQTPTLYETAARHSKQSMVAYNMYTRGAQTVVRPGVIDLARFTKGKGVLGLEAGAYDAKMLDELSRALRKASPAPDLITAYFMGLDHHSHLYGPGAQAGYLTTVIDPQLGRLLDTLDELRLLAGMLIVLVSDHGQSATPGDDRHSIRLGFPFDMELTPLFKALGLDLHDQPGEDPAVDAAVTLNGGMAHVYLRHRHDSWHTFPRYEEDVLRVAQAFHEMNQSGRYREELKGTLELILVRDAESEGWSAPYRAYLGDGQTASIEEWLAENEPLPYVDAPARMAHASSSMSGDLLLCARSGDGFYFGAPGLKGVHGSLSQADSATVLSFAMPGITRDETLSLIDEVEGLIDERCRQEGGRQPSIVDMAYVLRGLWLGDPAP